MNASTFQEQLVHFLKENNAPYFKNMSIVLYRNVLFKKWPTCKNFKFVLVDTIKPSGLMNIKVICGQHYQFVQVRIKFKGEYVIASRNIKKGKKLVNTDIFVKYGYLDQFPLDSYVIKKQVLNLVSLKDIKKNDIITQDLLRPVFLITKNERVSIIITNIGFTIISEGLAINNAYKNQLVKVKLDNGKIVSGIASNKNTVIIYS
ncbi:MAG: flagellar basal body P-ring formation chaperone FlgA [Buchnera aphidicola (Melaphis rhois)]